MFPVKVESSLWYEFDQNNSGGYFERGDFVADIVYIQAMSVEQACDIMREMVDKDDAEYWCECCGERWDFWGVKGFEVPTRYGKAVSEGVQLFSRDGYILFHGLNGRTLKWDCKSEPVELGRLINV